MRKNDIKGIVHDLLHIFDWRNPLERFTIKNKFVIDLVSGEIDYVEEDDLNRIYNEKREWFIERVENLGGNLEDFDKAIISVFGNKEKVEIVYKGKEFKDELVYERSQSVNIKEIRDKIKNLK